MQEKGKKKVIDNAGALQKNTHGNQRKRRIQRKRRRIQRNRQQSVRMQKNVAAVIIRECPMNNSCRKNRPMCAKTLGITVKSCRSSEWKIRIITEIKYTQCLMWSAGENMQTEADVPQETDMQRRHRAA